jgi:hypothetical protein
MWDFGGFGLRCLQLNTLNNYSVAAARVVVAAELDKFNCNMNNPTEWDRDWRIASVRIANKAVSPALQFAVEFVEHEVT